VYRRIVHLLTAAVLLAGLAGCREEIVHNLSEYETNKLLSNLHQQGVQGYKVAQADGRWAIAVRTSDSIQAIQAIDQGRLLRQSASADDRKSNLISSRSDQRFQYERALSHEIEHTLNSIEGVLESRVHLNLPPLDPLFGHPLESIKGSASVLIIGAEKSKLDTTQVIRLVAGACGVESDRISVMFSHETLEKSTPASPQASASSGFNSPSELSISRLLRRHAQELWGTLVIVCLLSIWYVVHLIRKRSLISSLNTKLSALNSSI